MEPCDKLLWRGYELPTGAEVLGLPAKVRVELKSFTVCGHEQQRRNITRSSNWSYCPGTKRTLPDEKMLQAKSAKKAKVGRGNRNNLQFNKQKLCHCCWTGVCTNEIDPWTQSREQFYRELFFQIYVYVAQCTESAVDGSIKAMGQQKMVSGWRKYVPLGRFGLGLSKINSIALMAVV